MKKTTAILAATALLLAFGSRSASGQETDIQVKEIQPFSYLCLHHTGPFTDIEGVIEKMMGLMQGQGMMPMGPMIGVYYNSPEEVSAEELDWELGFPLSEQATPSAPLEKKVWDFTMVAAAVHAGAYEETGQTYAKIFAWMQENGYEAAGPVLERYLTMPTPETKPEDLRAEIWVPVKKK